MLSGYGTRLRDPKRRSCGTPTASIPPSMAWHGVPMESFWQVGAISTGCRCGICPRYTTVPGGLYLAHPPASARGQIPHLHPVLIAPTGQKLSIGTPRNAIEGSIDAVGVPQDLHLGSSGRVPHPDGIVPPTAGKPTAIRTPSHPIHIPAMAAQHPGRRPAGALPDGHQQIRAGTGEPGAATLSGRR